jgi:GNAT superfamily N-acetyltransferase
MSSHTAVQIARATEQDVAAVLEMIRELAAYERMSHMVTATEEKIRRTLFGEHPFAEVLLASVENEIAGLAIFYTTYSTFLAEPGLYLEDLYVKPHARGKGVGSALLAHLARVAVERGWSRVEWSVLHWNESAIEFYRKIGAALLDDWKICRLAGASLVRMASQ